MRSKLRHGAFLIAGLLSLGCVQAQESSNTSGGDATGSGGTVAYSVGQVVYTTNTGNNGSVAQGVQQSYKIEAIGIDETKLNISLSVFPNPTADNLTLKVNEFNNEQLLYQLYDTQGKLLSSKELTAVQTQINMSDLPAATYFINVLNQEDKKFQSFKIVKN